MKYLGQLLVILVATTVQANDQAKVVAGALSTTEEDLKCYKARYYDLKDADPLEHYNNVGVRQGRHFLCGKKLTDYETQLYIDANPEVRSKFGDGPSSYQNARSHFSKVGRHDKNFLQLRDPKDQPFACADENQLCKCEGMIWMGQKQREDTGEAIKTFEEMVLFSNSKLETNGELTSCDTTTFGGQLKDGKPKQCFCEPKPEEQPYRCASHGESCHCPGGVVIYGMKDSGKN